MLDRLPGWMMHPDIPETRTVAKTVRENKEGILSHCGSRPANAYLEGTNSLIQPVKKAARGLHDVRYLATAIFLRLGGLSFDALTCAPT